LLRDTALVDLKLEKITRALEASKTEVAGGSVSYVSYRISKVAGKFSLFFVSLCEKIPLPQQL
jgi:hypothetical protein